MNYDLKLIKKQNQKTSQWSGGTTTELAIYPKGASYGDRNFKWRLSSAKVNNEESTFTHLQGINRWIMTLEGNIKLFHEGHGEKELKPFEPYNFSGEWNTKSVGKVKDFNLMLSDGLEGQIEAMNIEVDMSREMFMHKKEIIDGGFKKVIYALYCVSGEILVRTFYDEIKVSEEELLIINYEIDNENDEASPNLYIDIYNNSYSTVTLVNSIICEK